MAVLLAGWLAATVATALPAAAHAELVGSDPPDGSRLASAPARATLTFSENVSLAVGFVRVVDQRGTAVPGGPPQASGGVVSVPLPADLPAGGYLVSYQLVSADGHPVSGAVAFTVGAGPLLNASGAVLDGTGTDPLLGLLLGVARWVSYGGLALLGGVVFVRVCWPGGRRHRRVRRLVWAGWLGVVAAAGVELAGHGVYAAGRGVAELATTGAFRATLRLPVGQLLLLRLAALGVLAVLLRRLLARAEPPPAGRPGSHQGSRPDSRPNGRHGSRHEDAAGLVGLVVLLSFAGTGHAVAGAQPTVAVVADIAHLAAMAVWLGGLAVLVAGLLRLGRPDEVAVALPRFSRLAFWAVAVLVGTGAIRALTTLGTPAALWSTGYGRLLLVKVLAVAALLVLAGAARRAVGRLAGSPAAVPVPVLAGDPAAAGPNSGHGGGPEDGGPTDGGGRGDGGADPGPVLAGLRRAAKAEVAIGVAVLAVTAALVAQPPGRLAVHRPAAVEVDLGPAGTASVWLSPDRAGPNDLRVSLTRAGRPVDPRELTLTLALPAGHLGPLRVGLERTGPGGYRAGSVGLPRAGRWLVTVRVRSSTFDATVGQAAVVVR